MQSTTLEDAQAHLAEWIVRLAPGEELVINDKGRPVARLIKLPIPESDTNEQSPERHN
jgi:antitoxin (DNA-binding transcriptional repressor) of toxin-antitoxin stability system